MAITVITGEFSGKREERIRNLGWGRCYIERPVRPYDGEPWIFDNGAFRWFKAGLPFQDATFLARLGAAYSSGHRPLFGVVPDIVAGGLQSLSFSLSWLDSGRLPADWPWYFAVQDGMTVADVEPVIARSDVAGLFVGGSDDFKRTAPQWATLAHRYGKRCHYGRASTPSKLAAAILAYCDSCDSAFILWTEQRFKRYAVAWVEQSGVTDPRIIDYVASGCPFGDQQKVGVA